MFRFTKKSNHLKQLLRLPKIMKTKKGPEIKIRQKVLQSLIQKGYSMDVVQQAIAELNFEQDENILDDLLQKILKKYIQSKDVSMTDNN